MSRITVKKRHTIRKSHLTELKANLQDQIGDAAALFVTDRIERVETDTDLNIYLVDRKPQLMRHGTWVFPTVRGLVEHPLSARKVVVDQGAIRFVVNGADIMRPGIVEIGDDVRAGAPVQIVEERHGKPLAVGVALLDAAEMRGQEKGKSVKNIHYVGDDIWNLEI
ncbi:RNA-binding protein [Methanoculleus sp. FWC-SCC1]|uniref:RNA-binding protein n=1 Tax=Methanoculleus frigidifontis TaxID=2584085 RepID=A0ABT8M9Y7_9EURY|nr:RNA-binding protein [Methanoculleus sp. FWC-SCC1]MDN7024737.1 RNA-binding protein [Methanoculleus sp. FWC-SCC1]